MSYDLIYDIMTQGYRVLVIIIHGSDSMFTTEATNLTNMLDELDRADLNKSSCKISIRDANIESGLTIDQI